MAKRKMKGNETNRRESTRSAKAAAVESKRRATFFYHIAGVH